MTLLKRLFGRHAGPTPQELRLFLEAMIIMMAADGQIDDQEMAQFMAQVQTRDELRGLASDEVERHMRAASLAIKKEGVQARLQAIARGLPHPDQRMVAVSMALSIALGDRELARGEKQVLRLMQETFGLEDRQLDEAIDDARRGDARRLQDDTDAPPEQAYVEIMMLMTAADGDLGGDELEHFGHQLAWRAEFEALTPEQVGLFMERSLRHLGQEGVDARLTALSAQLPLPAQRLTAFRLALEIALVDGAADQRERALLKLLQERFALAEPEVEALIQQVLGARA
jgi:uncharacterized tellurite resistance protein B-like protein